MQNHTATKTSVRKNIVPQYQDNTYNGSKHAITNVYGC